MHAIPLRATLAALALATVLGVPAEAQWRDTWGASAQSEGYRDGARAGGDDARDGRPFEYQRHRHYREGDRGYDRGDGRRDDYKQQYRAGFVAGYRDGYNGGGGRGPSGGYSRPGPSRDVPWWAGRGPTYGGRYPGNTPVRDLAASNGFDDGYRQGLDDGRDGDRHDAGRHGRYRSADHGYRRDYGPKGLYQQAYRAAFERGYDDGYRDGRRRTWR